MEDIITSTCTEICIDAVNTLMNIAYTGFKYGQKLYEKTKEATISLAKEIVSNQFTTSFRTKRSLELDDLTKRQLVSNRKESVII